jgi:hypothetical protein
MSCEEPHKIPVFPDRWQFKEYVYATSHKTLMWKTNQHGCEHLKVNIFNIQVILIANFMAIIRVSRIETGVQNMDSG